MYLIRTDENKILNLEKGDLYRLEKNLLPENCHVMKNDELAVSGGAACLRLWDHLVSMLKFDATKAQDAPREFRVGQDVSVTLYGEIVAINGYEIKVEFDELAQPIVCVEQQLEPLNTD